MQSPYKAFVYVEMHGRYELEVSEYTEHIHCSSKGLGTKYNPQRFDMYQARSCNWKVPVSRRVSE